MRIAAVDLGTNSFLCLIADIVGDGPTAELKVISDTAKVVRLGEKVSQNKFFLPEALKRAENCLAEFEVTIRKYRADKVIATATSAARDVSNGNELIEMGRRHGIPIHIIEGKREAELSFRGAISSIPKGSEKKVLVIDVGGGSTELIYKVPGEDLKATSFDVGCVRLTEMFLKSDVIDPLEYRGLAAYAKMTIEPFGRVNPDTVIAVAGTPTTLACVDQKIDFDESKVEGYYLTKQIIERLAKDLGQQPLEARKLLKGMEPLRADVIVAGCALLLSSLSLTNQNAMTVSTKGLRYGVALHYKEFL